MPPRRPPPPARRFSRSSCPLRSIRIDPPVSRHCAGSPGCAKSPPAPFKSRPRHSRLRRPCPLLPFLPHPMALTRSPIAPLSLHLAFPPCLDFPLLAQPATDWVKSRVSYLQAFNTCTPHGFKPPVLSFPACSITTTWRCILHVHPPPRTTPHHTTPQQHRKKLILILRALAPFTYCSFCPIHVPPAAAAAAAPVAPAAGMACRGFLQCLLKLFNFALAIVGVLLIVYSLSRLIHLDPDLHPPNPPSPSPSPSPSSLSSSSCLAPVPMHLSSPLPDATQLVSGSSSSSSSSSASSLGGRRQLGASSNELRLPNLWFIYVLVGGGALLTLVTIVGAVAAESNNGCCLSCYQFGLCVLLLIQGSLAALVWLQDVPEDPTGEYERERAFVLRNLDLCRLAAVSLLLVE
ncbi:unnamed protein product, partial [Closterium sp. NIES-54]